MPELVFKPCPTGSRAKPSCTTLSWPISCLLLVIVMWELKQEGRAWPYLTSARDMCITDSNFSYFVHVWKWLARHNEYWFCWVINKYYTTKYGIHKWGETVFTEVSKTWSLMKKSCFKGNGHNPLLSNSLT